MFGGRRRSLVKQLWKQHQVLALSSSTPDTRDRTLSNKTTLKALVKRFKDRQMEILVQSIDGLSNATAGCVLVPKCDVHLPGGQRLAPHLLACQLWRWPGLEDEKRLKRLPICSSTSSSSQSQPPIMDAFVCCNPFHWSSSVTEEISIPRLLSESSELHQIANRSTSSVGDTSRRWMSPWCRLVYREYQHHIGGIFSIYDDWTRVFQDLFHGDGMCLSLIQNPTANKPVDRTRSKIGRGIILSREGDTVWLYNCSDHPVFVCSPSFHADLQKTGKVSVRRLPAGSSLKVYDCAVVDRLVSRGAPDEDWPYAEGPVFYDSVLVSFVKGWGKQYTRRFITSCPCWMEILLIRK